MSTKPIIEILPPVDDKIALILSEFSTLIDEMSNFGSHVLSWHMKSAIGGDEIAPVTLSFRHYLEINGAISACVKSSNIDPCKILLRAQLECFLGIAYILKEDSIKRGFAFLAVDAHKRLKDYKKYDKESLEGKKLAEILKNDILASEFFPDLPSELIADKIRNTEEYLTLPGPSEALKELRRLQNAGKKHPHWYSLYNGPENLEKLAIKLGYQALYIFLYKYWSSAIHGTDVIQGKLFAGKNKRPGIIQLKLPVEAQSITSISVSLGIHLYRLMIVKYTPEREKDYIEWYKSEIQNKYLRFSGENIITIDYGAQPA